MPAPPPLPSLNLKKMGANALREAPWGFQSAPCCLPVAPIHSLKLQAPFSSICSTQKGRRNDSVHGQESLLPCDRQPIPTRLHCLWRTGHPTPSYLCPVLGLALALLPEAPF